MNSTIENRTDAVAFLDGRINYERQRRMPYGERTMKLDRMRRLLERLDLLAPTRLSPIVHIAGTKGKGTTGAMIASIAGCTGLRVGIFTSPHLERVEQRLVVDGRPADESQFVAATETLRPVVEQMDQEAEEFAALGTPPLEEAEATIGPTYFECLTALALILFRQCKTDLIVLETGLGGRLDSTNIPTAALSVVTNISLDHTTQLGDTTAKIAGEKAGIIKPSVPVISGVMDEEARQVIRETCAEQSSPLIERSVDFDFEQSAPGRPSATGAPVRFRFRRIRPAASRRKPRRKISRDHRREQAVWPLPNKLSNLELPMPGAHQAENAAMAIVVSGILGALGLVEINEQSIRDGLARLRFPGRMEVVDRRPTVLLDGAHNVASARAVIETLESYFAARKRRLVFAATEEKDVAGMLRLLAPCFDAIYVTGYSETPRAVPAEQLARMCEPFTTGPICTFERPVDAIDAARSESDDDDLIVATGSLFLVAELRRHIVPAGEDGLWR